MPRHFEFGTETAHGAQRRWRLLAGVMGHLTWAVACFAAWFAVLVALSHADERTVGPGSTAGAWLFVAATVAAFVAATLIPHSMRWDSRE